MILELLVSGKVNQAMKTPATEWAAAATALRLRRQRLRVRELGEFGNGWVVFLPFIFIFLFFHFLFSFEREKANGLGEKCEVLMAGMYGCRLAAAFFGEDEQFFFFSFRFFFFP